MENSLWLRSEREKLDDRLWFWGRMSQEYQEYCREVDLQWQDEAATNFRSRFTTPHHAHLDTLSQQASLYAHNLELTEQPLKDFDAHEQRWTELVRLVAIERNASEAIQHDVVAALQGYSRYANLAQSDLREAAPLLAQLLEREKDE